VFFKDSRKVEESAFPDFPKNNKATE